MVFTKMKALKESKYFFNVFRNLSASHKIGFSHCENSTLQEQLLKLNNSGDCSQPYDISSEQETFITKGTEEARLKFHETLLFLFLKRSRGDKLPEAMTIAEYIDLMNQQSSENREKLLNMYCNRSDDEKIVTERSKEYPLHYIDCNNDVHDNSLFFHHFPRSDQFLLYNCFLGKVAILTKIQAVSH